MWVECKSWKMCRNESKGSQVQWPLTKNALRIWRQGLAVCRRGWTGWNSASLTNSTTLRRLSTASRKLCFPTMRVLPVTTTPMTVKVILATTARTIAMSGMVASRSFRLRWPSSNFLDIQEMTRRSGLIELLSFLSI
ncbi:hypothetical protein Acr_28g0004310 [Actinidia rufa]|uniref:Uncharacterized protein n=1 Tax=Actinidia rufa TaxID=165716 RepID=A0A7J0H9H3_9ERIC|nr:hypothetical protein Acr_28g0004310 [Actinidia rufa]